VEEAFRIRPGIKWINDLVYDRKKLAGILTELVFTDSQVCAIVGIGINCCQYREDFEPTIRDMATSIAMITEQTPNREQLAAKIIEQLSVMDTQLLTHRESLMDRYRADCVTLGQSVCVVQGDSVEKGEALDILPDGALRVRLEDGTQKVVNAGEVSIRGMYGYT
jgi:BirA family biotin operon repressor/biotin-[acetyl-CoA-carboxylase] ligase